MFIFFLLSVNLIIMKKTLNHNRWKRFDDWDNRRLRLDQFAEEDDLNGFVAFKSRKDPSPELTIKNNKIVSMDGKSPKEFDIIDHYIANYHLDITVAKKAMEFSSIDLAKMLVDINIPRENLIKIARGLTPAKLADVVSHLNSMEIAFAFSKMHARKTPGNQAHVTNAKDDPLQLAADAAVAVSLGFDEIETTMRVSNNSWSNALACAVGSSIGKAGTLFQCSCEEAEELAIGMAGFTSYAETVSVYGTESAFIDGDDTPWSKAWLTSAYASRGIKMRCTSGAAAELLMGFHESKSLLYLESRCLCLQRAIGAQGTQNGGIDGAPLASSIPGGVRELMAENLIAVWLDLECATGNDARHSESDMRVAAKVLPFLIGGSDLICSGFGSILKYDNSFNPSSFNGEELEEFLVLQRDFEADGALTSLEDSQALDIRNRALDAYSFVLKDLSLGKISEDMKTSVLYASGSNDTKTFKARDVGKISEKIKSNKITILEVIKSLNKGGYKNEAKNLFFLTRLKTSGDYLQTSAIIRNNKITSAINDPNEYFGPGTGYRLSDKRREEIINIRSLLNRDEIIRAEMVHQKLENQSIHYKSLGFAKLGKKNNEIIVGVSPAFGKKIFQTLAGHKLSEVLYNLKAGIIRGGYEFRLVRFKHTADTSFLGLSAARLSGSGIGIGLQAKGTAVIHKKDRLPHNNLELFSNAPLTKLSHYELMGFNSTQYAKGTPPEPVIVPTKGEALGARFHTRVALTYAIETSLIVKDENPEEILPTFKDYQNE